MCLPDMTLREIEAAAKNLRLKFLDKDMGIIFENGKPRIHSGE